MLQGNVKTSKCCLKCLYHVSILSKFMKKNICFSGKRPICFMCKAETVVKLKPNEIKQELKETTFSGVSKYYFCNYAGNVHTFYLILWSSHSTA